MTERFLQILVVLQSWIGKAIQRYCKFFSNDAFRLGCGDRMCDLGSAAVFSPDGAYTSIASPATPSRRANLTAFCSAGLRGLAQPKAQRGHIRQRRIKNQVIALSTVQVASK